MSEDFLNKADDSAKDRQVSGPPGVDSYNDGFGGGGIRITHKGGHVKDLFSVMIPWEQLDEVLHKIEEQKRLNRYNELTKTHNLGENGEDKNG